MAWLCDCDDGTSEMNREQPRPQPQQQQQQQQQQRMQGQIAADQLRMPPSEGELAPEFSGPRPGLEGQSEVVSSFTSMRTQNYGAIIEPREPSCGSRKKTSSSGDVIRRSDQLGQGAGKTSSRESRSGDKGSVKGDDNGPEIVKSQSKGSSSSSSSSSSTSTTTSDKRKRRKSRRKHRHRDSVLCGCPMYEVEVIKTAGAEALRGKQRPLPGSKPGMQVVTTETVTKRLYTYNIDIDLPEGVRISPRGKLVEDQGVSAENGTYDNMQPYGAQPNYQSPYGQAYSQPQRPQDQMAAPAERYMQIQQQQISTNGGRTAMMEVSSYEMMPRREASPPLMSQNLRGQMQIIRPQKVDSLVFQCLCGHDRGKKKSTTTTTTTSTSSTTSPTNTSTKTTKTSSSSRRNGRKSSTSSTTTKTSQKKGNKSSTSSTSTKTSQKKKENKSSTSTTTTKTSQKKKENKSSTSSTSTKTSQKNKENNSSTSSSSSSSTTTTTTTTNTSTSSRLKNQCKSGFVQVEIRCDRCRQRKTYLVCKECYSRHKITTCKDCKAPTVREYIRYPSQNALVRMAGQIVPCRPALPPPPPQSYQQQQQPYDRDDMVGALSNANGALIVCCSSKTMLPVSNADVYQDPGAAYGQGPITTNFVVGIVSASDNKESSSTSSSTTTTSSSTYTTAKSGGKSRTRSCDKKRTR